MKKKILHIIDSLQRGGAETLLIGVIREMDNFEHLIVLLTKKNAFEKETKQFKIFCLEHKKKINLLISIYRLKSIIKNEKIDIVHSHLYWSTIIARLSISKKIPLFSTYHSLLYDNKNTEQYSKKMLSIDKITYRRRYNTIFVSNSVKKLISKKVGMNDNLYVLHNYVREEFINSKAIISINAKDLNAVSIGNLRAQKNYKYVLQNVASIQKNFHLDIYGDGPEKNMLEKRIRDKSIDNVILKGSVNNISTKLSKYNLFILASSFEGFGIALLEAMAAGLPCLVSDIETFREVGKDSCIYFNLKVKDGLRVKIMEILEGKIDLEKLAHKSQHIAESKNIRTYVAKLDNLYMNA